MHVPVASLQTSRLGSIGRFQRVLMVRERKVAKNHPYLGPIILLDSQQRSRDHPAGRTLEITELLQSNWGLSWTSRMHQILLFFFCGLFPWNTQGDRAFGLVKHHPGANSDEPDKGHDYKGNKASQDRLGVVAGLSSLTNRSGGQVNSYPELG